MTRLILKMAAVPVFLLTGIVYLIFKFFTIATSGILGLFAMFALVISMWSFYYYSGVLLGLAWLVTAFLISPFGLPMVAVFFVACVGMINCSLRNFICS